MFDAMPALLITLGLLGFLTKKLDALLRSPENLIMRRMNVNLQWLQSIGPGEVVLFIVASSVAFGGLWFLRWVVVRYLRTVECPRCGNRTEPKADGPDQSIITIVEEENPDSLSDKGEVAYWCGRCGHWWTSNDDRMDIL